MARTMVYRIDGSDEVPFLRGILTRSLVKAGLQFDDAYGLAQAVRSDLKDVARISTDELSERIGRHLEARFGPTHGVVLHSGPEATPDITVVTPARSLPFSVGVMTHSLVACAIPAGTATAAAQQIQEQLKQQGVKEIGTEALSHRIYSSLASLGSRRVADRYLSWHQFRQSGRPLILLLGGVTGSGKSTIATELNFRLDVARTQSTDMIREIIRSYITLEVAPTLQYSSFEAWRGLPAVDSKGRRATDNPVVTGFLSQLSVVKPAVDAAIARAVQEQEHLILEGVHVVPSELELESASQSGIVLPVMIATTDKKVLRSRLKRRGRDKNRRGAKRYVDHVDEIWELQSHLLSAADAAGVSIIQNVRVESTIKEMMLELSNVVENTFPPDPAVLSSDT